jgi:hypothetical protein
MRRREPLQDRFQAVVKDLFAVQELCAMCSGAIILLIDISGVDIHVGISVVSLHGATEPTWYSNV